MNNKIIVDHNAGFFSSCTIRLKKIIEFYNKNKIYPIVDSSRQWVYYKDTTDDVTEYFFETNPEDGPFIDNYIDFFETNEDQFIEYNKLDYKNIQHLVNKYFTPSNYVKEIFQNLLNLYNIDVNNTIAICFRGLNKHIETNLPTHEEMISKLIEIKEKNPNHKILVQSDEIEFYNKVLNIYPDAIYFKEIYKITSNPTTSIQYHIPPNQKINQAVTFLAISLILSKCSKLITNSGNVGMWICFFRNNSDGVYQYLNHKEYIYGVYNTGYRVLENNWIDCSIKENKIEI
jgi:hypothetical protein